MAIVATANPEGGDYSVTPMDGAMINRMLHVSLTFDAKVWSEWAEIAGVDARGIAFVLTYPELVNAERTTPRSLSHFFSTNIEDLKANIAIVEALALSSLDEITVTSFISFIQDDLSTLINPDEILNAENFTEIEQRISDLASDGSGTKRLDRLSTICTRLYLSLMGEDYTVSKLHQKNLIRFLQNKDIPEDLLMSLYLDLSKNGNDGIKKMIRDKNLAKKLLKTL